MESFPSQRVELHLGSTLANKGSFNSNTSNCFSVRCPLVVAAQTSQTPCVSVSLSFISIQHSQLLRFLTPSVPHQSPLPLLTQWTQTPFCLSVVAVLLGSGLTEPLLHGGGGGNSTHTGRIVLLMRPSDVLAAREPACATL